MDPNILNNCIKFFNDLNCKETDITTEEEKQNGQLVFRSPK